MFIELIVSKIYNLYMMSELSPGSDPFCSPAQY